MRWSDNGPVCAVAVERVSALAALLSLIGPTPHNPRASKQFHPKSWTAQFGCDDVENGFYGSNKIDFNILVSCFAHKNFVLVPQSYEEGLQLLSLFFPNGVFDRPSDKVSLRGSDHVLKRTDEPRQLLLESEFCLIFCNY